MNKLEKQIQDEIDEWNHPDNVAYRNRNGCEFEGEEEVKYSFWDLKREEYNE